MTEVKNEYIHRTQKSQKMYQHASTHTYVCHTCGVVIDRDFNSSRVIEHEAYKILGRGPTEVTPAETNTSTLTLEYLNQIAYVKASMVAETGSLTALA
ncbi:MAG: hypothetical protein ACW963_01070 [Candidatus Sifarchaeia archaeon]|jgi:transposase